MNKKASIIIRTIDNRYAFLKRAVSSIFKNDYPEIEVVIVYQGTNQEYFNKLKLLEEEFERLKFEFINNPTNEDQRSKNADLGINAATGRYIGFLDDDDEFYPNHISELINYIQSYKKAWAYSKNAEGIEKNTHIEYHSDGIFYDDYSIKRLWEKSYISMISFLIDKEAIKNKKILKFNEKLNYGEDYLFILNLARYYEPAYCPKVLSIASFYDESLNIKTFNDFKSNFEKLKYEYLKNFFIRKEKEKLKTKILIGFYLKELLWHINNNFKYFKRKPLRYLSNALKGEFLYIM